MAEKEPAPDNRNAMFSLTNVAEERHQTMTRSTLLQAGVATLAALGLAASVPAQAQTAFTPGNIVVSQIGAGTETLTANGNTTLLDEYTTLGAPVQQLNLTTAPGNAYVNSGGASSEGALTLSGNGQFLTIGGYKATPGQTSSVSGATSTTVNREIAVIAANGTVDKSTALTDAYSANNFRSVASADGINFVTGGTATTTGGTRSTALGATTSTSLAATPTNIRVVNLFGGSTFASSASGSNIGINIVSGGTTTLLAGTGTSLNAYDFVFTNGLNTLYVADSTAGIQKYTLSGSTYSLAYTFTGAAGLTGLAATTVAGQTVLYSVNPTNLFTVTDAGAATTLTSLATAPTGTAFRGVDFAPVAAVAAAPEPSGVVALALGAGVLGLMTARRRRQTA